MSMMTTANGKTALITGASSGIGLGVAEAYRGRGANVVLNARNQANLRDTAAALGALNTSLVMVVHIQFN